LLALTGGVLLSATPAAAAVSPVTFSGSSTVAAATGTTWTVGFNSSIAENSADTITVTFASGFTFSSPTVTLLTGFTDCAASPAVATNVVTITLTNSGGTCSYGSSTAATLSISGVTNPAAGTYTFSLFSVAITGQTPATNPTQPVVISAAATSAVTFSGSSMVGGATGTTWTIGFTTNAAETIADTITVVFATGFTVSSPTITLLTGFSSCGATPSVISPTVIITLSGPSCSYGSGTAATLSISGVTNPPAATYPNTDFTVTVDSQTATSPVANVTITGLTTITFVGSSQAASATGTTWTVGFTSSASGALAAAGTISVTFATGFGIPSTPMVTLGSTFIGCTSTPAATASTTGLTVTITLGAGCTLAASTAATVTIAGITNPVAGTYPDTDFTVGTSAQAPNSPAASVVIGGATPLPTQIYGTDAIGTSIAVSQAEFPTAGSAGAVVLARDDFFSDALAGGPLAAAVNGPLLITAGAPISSTLDARVQAEIQRVLPTGGTVYILGGDLALSSNIDTTLAGLGYTVVREAGADEYATAVDVAGAIATTSWGTPSTVFEATGLYFYDALSAVPAAIKVHAAILLTNGTTQAPETATYLAAHPGDTRYTIGGLLAAEAADPTATNISGQDLYNTSAAVASHFFPNPLIFGAATSAEFPDALGGGVFMATGGRSGPILLVAPSAPLPTEIVPYLNSLPVGTQGYVFGGPLAVAGSVLSALQAAVG
jgi:putative cell wall-binding protein